MLAAVPEIWRDLLLDRQEVRKLGMFRAIDQAVSCCVDGG